MNKLIDAGALTVAYEETGAAQGWPVILLHGFPYDIRAYDAVSPLLATAGARAIVPWLRGYGPTRFRSSETPRSGQQAAIGKDLLDFMDALGLGSAVLAGYDWGGRAACIVAALWPDRVSGLVSQNSYNIQNIPRSTEPATPENEQILWYQYYLHSERGRQGLSANRRDFCRLLWRLWSPKWQFDEATFQQTAESFDNPDFVEIVVHSYRHRFGLSTAPGDPTLEPIERQLAAQPPITVPSITLDGDSDGVLSALTSNDTHFTGRREHRIIKDGGHNLPQEKPEEFASAILDVRRRAFNDPSALGRR